jgi:tetratricopeptide (TPR) repeat protein
MADLAATTAQKVETAKQKKETGDQAFKAGLAKEALLSYHQALMYLLGLDKNALQSIGMVSPAPAAPADASADSKEKEKNEVDEILEKVYSNMAACHLKNGNFQRAVETADKALAKNENNGKAMFRKAKALGELGYFEKAVKILEDLKKKSPADVASADQEIARLTVIDNERERVHKKKMKGFLNKAEKKGTPLFDESSVPTAIKSGFIEEVKDDDEDE